MSHAALRVLREEHAALAALLQAIPRLLEKCRRQDTAPDIGRLRAMLFYIDEVAQRPHHWKEEKLFFPKLRARAPLSRHLIDQIQQGHSLAERNIREFAQALNRSEVLGRSCRQALEHCARRCVDFYLAHMEEEERHVMTLAEIMLTNADWEDLDQAFTNDRCVAARHRSPGNDIGRLAQDDQVMARPPALVTE
jgi:hemerythrin-like domain-containing protein